jgi:tRNA(Ile)-lysidine synthetase-like protein
MKYVLAISGGVDSVVLLDMVAKGSLPEVASSDCLVAHFDHGIRAESGVDAELVKKLAARYQMKFALGQGKLGKDASEQSARQVRYRFLRDCLNCHPELVSGSLTYDEILKQVQDDRRSCKRRIVTAHHQDDLIETILMNLIRGTGWRGLAPMWSSDIIRPLLKYSKAELVAYAIKNKLEWAEDETNYSPKYFRNRLRDRVVRLSPKQRQELLKLNQKQTKLRTEVESLLNGLSLRAEAKQFSSGSLSFARDDSYPPPQNDNDSHYHFTEDGSGLTGEILVDNLLFLPENVGLEVLRKITQQKLTMPQLERLLDKLKTAKSGDVIQPGGNLQIGLYGGEMTVSQLKIPKQVRDDN